MVSVDLSIILEAPGLHDNVCQEKWLQASIDIKDVISILKWHYACEDPFWQFAKWPWLSI